MKRIMLLLILAACTFSCQKEGQYSIDEPYVFPNASDPETWKDLDDLEDRFSAFQIPENILSEMTTNALVLTMVQYPLNPFFTAYDQPETWITQLETNVNLYQEIKSRKHSLKHMADVLEQRTFRDYSSSYYDPDSMFLSLLHELFFEYFIVYMLENSDQNVDKEQLNRTAERKLSLRQQSPEIYSRFSLLPLQRMIELTEE